VNEWFFPGRTSVIPDGHGWHHAGLRLVTLAPGERHQVPTAGVESLILPLAGAVIVECDGERAALTGRDSVFAGPSDFCYLPPDSAATVSASDRARIALPFTAAARGLPFRYVKAADVAVELRGAGACSRQVNNLAAAGGFECQRLIVVEVLTPGGNWSSYPPHKHDEHSEHETALEEIYYFEVAAGGVGYQRVYAADPARPIDVLAEVRSGDIVLVPHGWHGPSIAAPGYDLYYLNVMAGPGLERAWRFRDDPAHAWVRATWAAQSVDPRLPVHLGGDRR
jgi:5-deoxy-glucuronate isomerase